jgi:hypothetical protein
MKSIIHDWNDHDWNDERSVRILANCRHALSPGARLMVIDRVMPDNLEPKPEHPSAALSDLNMLLGPGGCERTPSEFRALLAQGGFSMRRMIPTGRYSVIEGAAD